LNNIIYNPTEAPPSIGQWVTENCPPNTSTVQFTAPAVMAFAEAIEAIWALERQQDR
jgi:hypothetical protein